MNDRTRGEASVEAALQDVLGVVADVERYPEWTRHFRRALVKERAVSGRPRLVEFDLDAGLLKDTFTLDYVFTESASGAVVTWTLVEAGLLRQLDGRYRLVPEGTRTHVSYEVRVDPGIPVLGVLRRKAERAVVDAALDDLARRVRGEAAG